MARLRPKQVFASLGLRGVEGGDTLRACIRARSMAFLFAQRAVYKFIIELIPLHETSTHTHIHTTRLTVYVSSYRVDPPGIGV